VLLAYFYTSNIDMFKQIEVLFNTKGIRLELPNTNKVQVWTTEGEMLNIEKKELLQNTSDISDYLIQFGGLRWILIYY